MFVGGAWAAWTGTGKAIDDVVLGTNRLGLPRRPYSALMTDAYPPFRLDMGGDEPPTGPAPDTVRPTPAPVISTGRDGRD